MILLKLLSVVLSKSFMTYARLNYECLGPLCSTLQCVSFKLRRFRSCVNNDLITYVHDQVLID